MNDYQYPNEPKKINESGNIHRKKTFFKGMLSTVTAGVVGSVLTLTVVTQTDLLQQTNQSDSVAGTEIVEKTTSSSNILATPTSTSAGKSSIADIVEQASPAIVGIVNFKQQSNRFAQTLENVESGSGTGVIFKKTKDAAYIVTNNHVIEGASEIEISLHNGKKIPAQLIGADALTDLAVLKIEPKYADNVLTFGDSSMLRAGEEVLAIGNPLGLEFSRTVTQGIVSAVDRTISVSTSAGEWDLNVIQTDAAINPGNSGGALMNTQGEVIGINSLKISESGVEGLGFAIPSNDVLPIVNEIIENGQVERPYLGVSLADLQEIPLRYLQSLPEKVNEGAMVTFIDPDSAARKAGLNVQDVIVAIDGKEISSTTELRKYLYSDLEAGDHVSLKVYRGNELKTVEVTLESTSSDL
ncbi:S1C family serine protease [Bacillus dakarensis]|uniref:S1C family serine protease n=1 Tax=Robertmurraya dakarensis TaxID=1926278 RepID=UPI000981957F|nr:trypsin-like peptidase domain-containing protein [Bacillus dakarensis]